MCAIRVHINKSIFEKVLLGQFSINFLQNWFYYYVPSHISKIAFFFSSHFSSCPYYCQPINKQQTVKHYTNILSNLYKLYSLSL